jgi:uncharacterized protein YdeI (YjbR/CyaY-like superfamily)
VLYKKHSGKPVIGWSGAVDEALCFGWVDSKRMPLDKDKFLQFFCSRKSTATWSKINKEKVRRLIDEGAMKSAGLECIKAAKQNGSWTVLDDVEELKIPAELNKRFKDNPGSKDFFLSLSKSVRKEILQWVVLAKRPETRQRRIAEIAELAALKLKPRQFR